MRHISFYAALLLLALMSGAVAQEADRYTLEKSGEGFVRLDRRTGEVSRCEERAGELVCRVAADERAALEDELARLRSALDALDRRVAVLESGPGPRLTDTREFEQTMGAIDRLVRGFIGMVRDLEDEFNDPDPAPADPQRT